eukprot:COSAG02_NODE_61033_length_269_cov_1.223529_1_plen_28_part_10
MLFIATLGAQSAGSEREFEWPSAAVTSG